MVNKTLIKLRIDFGLKQADAAKKIGISQSMLSLLERGIISGTDTTKIKVANFYGKSVESIFFANASAYRNSENEKNWFYHCTYLYSLVQSCTVIDDKGVF